MPPPSGSMDPGTSPDRPDRNPSARETRKSDPDNLTDGPNRSLAARENPEKEKPTHYKQWAGFFLRLGIMEVIRHLWDQSENWWDA